MRATAPFDDAGLPAWFSEAACLGMFSADDDPWFEPGAEGSYAAALAVCERGCPVREPCGQHALAEGYTEGVWGGMTERERQNARQGRQEAA